MTKNFISIVGKVVDNKLVLLYITDTNYLYNANGISTDNAIKFLWLASYYATKGRYLVSFAFQIENEFIFRELSKYNKDRLFQVNYLKQRAYEIREEMDTYQYELSLRSTSAEDIKWLKFALGISKTLLADLMNVNYNHYNLRLINGKLTIIEKDEITSTIYDVYGFFRQTLYDTVHKWLGKKDKRLLVENQKLLSKKDLIAYARLESNYIAKVTQKMYDGLAELGIKLNQFYGISAVSSLLLSKAKATKEFHSYRFRRQLGTELYDAVQQSYYGGRTEQLKIGSFNDGVSVYDINSAYACAISMLPQLLSKPRLTRTWTPTPFSLWYCEFDLTKTNIPYGVLPYRTTRNLTNYTLQGKGFFWQPEIMYLLQYYPDNIVIHYGYKSDYKESNFGREVAKWYEMRQGLTKNQKQLDKILKLTLSSIYGKFCQREGKALYYNLLYAGFVTSFTRAQLLHGAHESQNEVISFLTDAIHFNGNVDIETSNELGGWRQERYDKAEYLDIGIYRLWRNEKIIKEKTRGFRVFNFSDALLELQHKRYYTADIEYFVGHNLSSYMPIKYDNYLSLYQESKQTNPFIGYGRRFLTKGVDLINDYANSVIINRHTERASGKYQRNYFRESDVAKDSLMAKKI